VSHPFQSRDGQLLHGDNQIRTRIHAALTTDGTNLKTASFANCNTHTIATQQSATVAGGGVGNFLFIQRSLKSQRKLFKVRPELILQIG
jgi:hypothetical protein